MYIVLLIAAVFVVSAIYLYLKNQNEYWRIRGVPQCPPKPLFGNSGDAIMQRKPLFAILHDLYNQYKGYSYVGFYNLMTPAIVIRNPEIAKTILIGQFTKFRNNWVEVEPNVDPVFSYNPFTLNDNLWKTIRTQLTPLFTTLKVKSMFPVIQQGCESMIHYLKTKSKQNKAFSIDANDLSARFIGDNVLSCAYGLEGNSFNVEVPDTFRIAQQIANKTRLLRIKQTLALFVPIIRRMFKITILGDPVPKLFSDIILSAVKYREENNIKRNDYLDFIKELADTNTIADRDQILVAHAFTFFLDGFETSSVALAYALLEIAQRPDIQKRSREEIQTVLDKHDNKLTYDAVQEMRYIENIVYETLRKHPIILFISRVCNEDCVFPSPRWSNAGKDVVIEKGTHIFIPPLSIHNDPEYYPNPHVFRPDRFNDDANDVRPKCSFLGFGDGPRICLGRQFALMQLKMGLISTMLHFEIKVNKETQLPVQYEDMDIFNSPKTTIKLDFIVY